MFTAFEGGPKEQVDEYLRDFYDKVIAGQKRFRPKARAAMNALRDAGVEVVIVSATFGPIVRRAQEFEPFDVSLCTEMEVDANGNYTRRVDGECVEGEAKVRAITKWANEKYGAGNWELSCAFGDHHLRHPHAEPRRRRVRRRARIHALRAPPGKTIGMRSIGIARPRNSARARHPGSRFRRDVRV